MEMFMAHQGYRYAPSGNIIFFGNDGTYSEYLAKFGDVSDCGEEGQCGPVLPIDGPGLPIPTIPQDCGTASPIMNKNQCGPIIKIEDE
ncbi:hypothetical protein WNZ14_09355 [Hoeflea sp. AS60]|uniref:hypothetical protein n=1 Tax=Hoeflea sp. AS60 TaxID=3135780 RepID=UPI00316BE43D